MELPLTEAEKAIGRITGLKFKARSLWGIETIMQDMQVEVSGGEQTIEFWSFDKRSKSKVLHVLWKSR